MVVARSSSAGGHGPRISGTSPRSRSNSPHIHAGFIRAAAYASWAESPVSLTYPLPCLDCYVRPVLAVFANVVVGCASGTWQSAFPRTDLRRACWCLAVRLFQGLFSSQGHVHLRSPFPFLRCAHACPAGDLFTPFVCVFLRPACFFCPGLRVSERSSSHRFLGSLLQACPRLLCLFPSVHQISAAWPVPTEQRGEECVQFSSSS